jgi:hypothetical protein
LGTLCRFPIRCSRAPAAVALFLWTAASVEACRVAGTSDPPAPPSPGLPALAPTPALARPPDPAASPPEPSAPADREGKAPGPPAGHTRTLRVPQFETPPVIDGRLDDACWNGAACAVDFWVCETNRPPREATEVRVGADAETLYFAIRCLDAAPAAIVAQQTKRDGDFGVDDSVTVQLDAYHNHRQISGFSVNALGTQADAIAGGRARKIEWKGDWKAAAVRTAEGWTAELAIPFAVLNYAAGTDTFGVNFLRYHHRTGEISRWADLTPALRSEEMGHLTGLTPPARSAPPLSVMTYTAGGINSPNRAGHRRPLVGSTGVDLRYNAANNLTGMASLYPDFSQVEDEVVGLAFSYNEKVIPDHRPFFQEGSGFFGSSRLYFYSGRIPNFDAGGKLFGRVGTTQVGALGVVAPEGRQDYAARAVWEFGPRTNVALVGVGSERSDSSNQLLALQASTRSAQGLAASLDVAGTRTRGRDGDGTHMSLSLGHEGPYLQYGVSATRTGQYFFPADGFINGDRLGTAGGSAYVSYSREYADRWYRVAQGSLSYSARDTLSGLLQSRSVSVGMSLETHSQRQLTFSYSAGPYRPRAKQPGEWSKTVNQDWLFTTSLAFNTRSSRGGYGLSYAWGNLGGGRYADLAPYVWWKPSPAATLSYSYERAVSFGTTRQGVLSLSWDLSPQQSVGLRWVDYQGKGYWRVAFRRAVARGMDIYALFTKDPDSPHRVMVKLVHTLSPHWKL